MINLIKMPQRADTKAEYTTNNDILTVKIGEAEETFDFTDLPDGEAEEVIAELLPINPIVSVKKENGIIDITVIRFYGKDEKELFEVSEDGKN